MNFKATIRNLISRIAVNRPGAQPQVTGLGDRVYPDVENLQPQGLYFNPPAGAQGAMLSPAGDPSVALLVGVGGDVPVAPAAGEGGLHYLGTYKLFLAADGSVHVGQKDPTDFVALASKVDAQLTAFKTAIAAGLTAVGVGAAANGPTGASAFNSSLGPNPLPVGSTSVRCK